MEKKSVSARPFALIMKRKRLAWGRKESGGLIRLRGRSAWPWGREGWGWRKAMGKEVRLRETLCADNEENAFGLKTWEGEFMILMGS
jgi:hypothetical protein